MKMPMKISAKYLSQVNQYGIRFSKCSLMGTRLIKQPLIAPRRS